MIYEIPKPEISPDFTIDDIHKIREWSYEVLKDASVEERIAYNRESARRYEERIAALRAAQPKSA